MPLAASDNRITWIQERCCERGAGEALKAKGYLQRNRRGELL